MIVSMAYPTVYMQEPELLTEAGATLRRFGSRLFVIAGRTAWEKAGPSFSGSLKEAGLPYAVDYFRGVCTYEEAARLQGAVPPGTDLIVAVGGGQCMDAAKLAAVRSGLPIATVPTLASTCASTTPLSIMYDSGHRYVSAEYFDTCPVLTLADTRILAEAPWRYLVAGIGDTLAKWYEAYPINAGKRQDARTRLGLQIAKLAKEMLFEYGEQAIGQCRGGEPGEAVRQIVDVNLLFAGLVGGIGHYTCRGSGAHSFHNGMTAIPGIDALHGEIVAFGIVCQLMLEGRPKQEIERLHRYYRKVGLPLTLHDLNIREPDEGELRLSAQRICDPKQNIHHLPFEIREEAVYEAILQAHAAGERAKRAGGSQSFA